MHSPDHYQKMSVFAGLALVLTACASLPTHEQLASEPAPHLSKDAPAQIVDGRARFETLFCEALGAGSGSGGFSGACEQWLYPAPAGPPMSGRRQAPLQVLLVPGAFSECLGESGRPFGSAVEAVRAEGYRIDTVPIAGRSGTEHNARQIADFLDQWAVAPDVPLVLLGYSKGLTDALQFLVDYPDRAARVSAVVGLAGAVGGSPIADNFDGLYRLFSRLPLRGCSAGDREVVHSLRTDVRQEWLRANELPPHIRYYSLAAFTTRERVARALVPSWKTLLSDDLRNDGQLLPADALIPGSTLLGYLNADHWAVALDLESELPFLAHRRTELHFPHAALLQAIVRYVAEDQAH